MQIQQIHAHEIELAAQLFHQYRLYYNAVDDINVSINYLKERLQQQESVVFVALTQAGEMMKPVGFTQLYPVYSSVRAVKNWVLNDLFVDEQYRSTGIGKALIITVIDFASKQGATYVQLETGQENLGAQKLYEAVGFTRYDPHENYLVYKIHV